MTHNHLQEIVINNKPLLVEYYRQLSSPLDNNLLNGWSVWIYGNDCPQYPPHCHLILGNHTKPQYNIEIHLVDLEAYHMECPTVKNISWHDLDDNLKNVFFEWLTLPPRTSQYNSNIEFLLSEWDGNNPNNTIEQYIKKKNLSTNNVHPLINEYIFGKPIDSSELVGKIFEIVLPIYQNDKELRDKLHSIKNPLEFAQNVHLPFDFNEHNFIPKFKKIIVQYEQMCYDMTR